MHHIIKSNREMNSILSKGAKLSDTVVAILDYVDIHVRKSAIGLFL